MEQIYPLHIAAKWDKTDGAQRLVKLINLDMKNINQQDDEGNTPLHVAVKYTNVNTVKVLLDNNADIHIKNNNDQYPIDMLGHNQNNNSVVQIKELMQNVLPVVKEPE